MGIMHAKPSEPISVSPLGSALSEARTTALVKTDSLEVLRMIVPQGKEIAGHRTRGEVTIQCLEGEVGIVVNGITEVLSAGQLLYLCKNELHAVRGIRDASLLVTILLA
jgi:quercetin dioxygenase-like cupin family protein